MGGGRRRWREQGARAGPPGRAGPEVGPAAYPGCPAALPGGRAPACTATGCAAIFRLPLCRVLTITSPGPGRVPPPPLRKREQEAERGEAGARGERAAGGEERAGRRRGSGKACGARGLEPRREGAALSPPRCCSAETRRPEQEGSGQPWGNTGVGEKN